MCSVFSLPHTLKYWSYVGDSATRTLTSCSYWIRFIFQTRTLTYWSCCSGYFADAYAQILVILGIFALRTLTYSSTGYRIPGIQSVFRTSYAHALPVSSMRIVKIRYAILGWYEIREASRIGRLTLVRPPEFPTRSGERSQRERSSVPLASEFISGQRTKRLVSNLFGELWIMP